MISMASTMRECIVSLTRPKISGIPQIIDFRKVITNKMPYMGFILKKYYRELMHIPYFIIGLCDPHLFISI